MSWVECGGEMTAGGLSRGYGSEMGSLVVYF